MNAYVVDTNVAIAANGRNTHADYACRFDCNETLEAICRVILNSNELLFID